MALSELNLRKWGTTEEIPLAEGNQVRQLTVNPGAELPRRINDFQCEHWVVVKGVGRVLLETKSFLADEGTSVFIPARAAHAVENIGDVPLRIVAIHYGPEWPSAGARLEADKTKKPEQSARALAAE